VQRLIDLMCAISIGIADRGGGGNLQAAAVRMTRRAQWFLINLPILRIKERIRAVNRARGRRERNRKKKGRESKFEGPPTTSSLDDSTASE
jgi:hypothetical protein